LGTVLRDCRAVLRGGAGHPGHRRFPAGLPPGAVHYRAAFRAARLHPRRLRCRLPLSHLRRHPARRLRGRARHHGGVPAAPDPPVRCLLLDVRGRCWPAALAAGGGPAHPNRPRAVAVMVTAAAFVVPAMWLKRMIMVTGPATYDRITSAFGAYHFTWTYISMTLAATAAVPLLLMLLFRIVPLLSIDEIEQTEGIQETVPATAHRVAPEP